MSFHNTRNISLSFLSLDDLVVSQQDTRFYGFPPNVNYVVGSLGRICMTHNNIDLSKEDSVSSKIFFS